MQSASVINLLLERHDLEAAQVAACLEAMLTGAWSEAQIAAVLIALRAKGEQPAELAAGVEFLLQRCVAVPVKDPARLLDTAGTGGDRQGTFNISTAAAFVAAAAGVLVAKHGNRAQSGVCGSADLLAKLGCRLDLPVERTAACLEQTGICFMFAQAHHPALKAVAPVRQQLGVRTLFNLLGPLANPAGAKLRLIGVFADEWVLPYAQTCRQLGISRAVVVHATGLDEFSLTGKSRYALLDENGEITEHETSPDQLQVQEHALAKLQVHDQDTALAMFNAAIDNEAGAPREAVVLNSAAAIFAAGKEPTLADAVTAARAVLDAGKARAKVDEFIAFSSA